MTINEFEGVVPYRSDFGKSIATCVRTNMGFETKTFIDPACFYTGKFVTGANNCMAANQNLKN